MEQDKLNTRRISQCLICLVALVSFIFLPSLHKLEHARQDTSSIEEYHNSRTEADFPGHEASFTSSAKESQPCPDHAKPFESGCNQPLGQGLGEDCALCQILYLLSLNSMTLTAFGVLVWLLPAESLPLRFSDFPISNHRQTAQARAPPVTSHLLA